MTPSEVDALTDTDFAAMVRVMTREAREIAAAANRRK
jgi:hypothetical protein